MRTIEEGALVIAHCMAPKERLWGLVLRLDGVDPAAPGLARAEEAALQRAAAAAGLAPRLRYGGTDTQVHAPFFASTSALADAVIAASKRAL